MCTNGWKVHIPLQPPRRTDTRRLRIGEEQVTISKLMIDQINYVIAFHTFIMKFAGSLITWQQLNPDDVTFQE